MWFVMAWVVLVGVVAIGASVFSYTFVRDRAAEFDDVLDLPDPPQVGRPGADTGSAPVASAPTQTPPPTAPAVAADPADTDPTPAPTTAPDTDADLAAATPPDDATDPASDDSTPADAANDDAAADPAAAAGYEPWADPRRVNVLLLGVDQRAGETGPFPTDTIILFSLDPVGKTAAILSIPRDLWVGLPGLGRSARINTANIVGDDINYPGGGGPAYAAQVVAKELGLNKIDFYVLINFEVFYTVIDAVGPIEVCPTEEIHDEEYPDGSYGYMTVHFDPGCQDLDAERLLQYARTRHGNSDIDRSARQQEVILGVREEVLSAGGVLALVPQAATLWQSMQDNVKTNLTFDDMVSLGLKAEEIASDDIRQGQISFGEVFISIDEDGSEILVPISSDIQTLLSDLFRPAGTPSTRAPAEAAES